MPLALAGGVFLLWLAWRSWHAAPTEHGADLRAGPGLGSSFGGSLLLTLSNPATILSFIAVFGALGASSSLGASASLRLMVAGVLTGSAPRSAAGLFVGTAWSRLRDLRSGLCGGHHGLFCRLHGEHVDAAEDADGEDGGQAEGSGLVDDAVDHGGSFVGLCRRWSAM